jgi:hypothetical protein
MYACRIENSALADYRLRSPTPFFFRYALKSSLCGLMCYQELYMFPHRVYALKSILTCLKCS